MKLSGKNILVTGGGGFLGGAIVRLLVDKRKNAENASISSFSRGFYPELESMGVGQIRGDLSDRKTVDRAVSGMDIVFHAAAKPGVWGDFSEYYDVNVTGTENVIAACRHKGVSSLVYTSSPSVVFDGTDMEGVNESVPYPGRFHAFYPRTKALAEQAVIEAGGESLRTIALRPHLIWGPRDNHLIPRIIARANQLVRVGDGTNLVDTVYIDNAAEAHILAAEKLEENPDLSGNVYFISQDAPVPLWDMINDILKAAGYPPVKRSMPRWTAWLIGAVFEWTYKRLGIRTEPRMTRFVATELATSHWFDISAAKRDLGYFPRVSIEEGLERLENWLQNREKE
jgi:nucleoside-diphosphate-sugar epimerase